MSNVSETTEQPQLADIILRRNNDPTTCSCAKCGTQDHADVPFMAALEGSERWVCLDCFEKYVAVPNAAQALRYLNAFVNDPLRPRFAPFIITIGANEFPPRRPLNTPLVK